MSLATPERKRQILSWLKSSAGKYAKPFDKGNLSILNVFGGSWNEYAEIVMSMIIADTLLDIHDELRSQGSLGVQQEIDNSPALWMIEALERRPDLALGNSPEDLAQLHSLLQQIRDEHGIRALRDQVLDQQREHREKLAQDQRDREEFDRTSREKGDSPRLGARLELYLGRLIVNPSADGKAAAVAPGSPAARSGLLPGDEIIRMNGVPITRVNEMNTALADLSFGDTIPLEIRRKTEAIILNLDL